MKVLVLIPGYLENNMQYRDKLVESGYEIVESTDIKKTEISTLDEQFLATVDAVITGVSKFGEAEFQRMPNLKLLCKTGKGVDSIDLVAAAKHGVIVTNTAGSNADAVAEIAICYMILASRYVLDRNKEVKSCKWFKGISGCEIQDKVICFLGFGDIAQRIARRLLNFNVIMKAYDVHPNKDLANELNVELVSFDDLLKCADILTVHIPNLPETFEILNAKSFAMLKPGCKLINTSRGQVINEKDLAKCLKDGTISYAALDTFQNEPIEPDNELLKLENVLLTPHIAGSSEESAIREIRLIINNLLNFKSGTLECLTGRLT